MLGVPHPQMNGMYLFEGPRLARLPAIAILYSIDDDNGVVVLWNCWTV
ncbi:MAG: hypothetical protein ACOY7L_18270 [Pseudomonadota bacterium]